MEKREFNEKILSDSKHFYDRVYKLLDEVKGNDAEKYEIAYFNMQDGKVLEATFEPMISGKIISINNCSWDNEKKCFIGDYFNIMQDSAFGFFMEITIYDAEKGRFDYKIADEENPYENDLSYEEQGMVSKYMEHLFNMLRKLEYDKEAVQTPDNYNCETKLKEIKNGNIEVHYNEKTMDYELKRVLKKKEEY